MKQRMVMFVAAWFLGAGVGAQAGEWSGEAALESRLFPRDSVYGGSGNSPVSLRLTPEFLHDWDKGDQRLAVTLFGRVDSGDEERTHWDIRELYWRWSFNPDWDLYMGVRKVFWGVTESAHLVDVINQTDLVDNPDGEDKLGQPMVAATWVQNWGTLDLFLMPLFRERTFSGVDGRLHPGPAVDTGNPVFASAAEETHIDLAARWSHYLGNLDLGLAYFSGTSREPGFLWDEGRGRLRPYYGLLNQASLDAQYTRGDWAFKLEAVARELDGARSTAAVGGFEYTLVGLLNSSKDLGLIAEYQFDDRRLPTLANNDLVLGGRLGFNDVHDTELLLLGAVDTEDGSLFGSIEGSRRVGMNWRFAFEARMFANTTDANLLHGLRREDYMQLEFIRFF